MEKQNPILNNPYEEPKKHYATDPDGNLNYDDIREGRRIFTPDIQAIPVRQGPQGNLFEVNDLVKQYGGHLINLVRAEVGKWRDSGYAFPVPTRVTKELLDFWFMNPERQFDKRLFFAQREAIETAVWFNEIAAKSNAGQNILNMLKSAQAVNGLICSVRWISATCSATCRASPLHHWLTQKSRCGNTQLWTLP